jgi:hypothetical protein
MEVGGGRQLGFAGDRRWKVGDHDDLMSLYICTHSVWRSGLGLSGLSGLSGSSIAYLRV